MSPRVALGSFFVGLMGVAVACESFDSASSSEPDASTTDAADDGSITTSDAGLDGTSSTDADADAGERACDLSRTFDNSEAVGVSGSPVLNDFTLVGDDELEAIVSVKPPDSGQHALFRTSRSSRKDPFGPLGLITELSQTYPNRSLRGGSLSPDGLTLLFFFNIAAPPFEMYVAKKVSVSGSFETFQKVSIPGVDASTGWVHPHFRKSGDVVLFSTIDPDQAWRGSWNGGANALEAPNQLGSISAHQPQRTAEATNGDVITFGTVPDGGPVTRLHEAVRLVSGGPLSPARQITEVALAGGETNQDVSRDGCRIYFTDSIGNLHVAERKKP